MKGEDLFDWLSALAKMSGEYMKGEIVYQVSWKTRSNGMGEGNEVKTNDLFYMYIVNTHSFSLQAYSRTFLLDWSVVYHKRDFSS